VEVFINAEQDRTHSYLSFHTSAPLQSILISKLLTPHTSRLLKGPDSTISDASASARKLDTALDRLIDAERTEDLARLLRMFLLPPEDAGMKLLRQYLKESIIGRGRAINEECDEGAAAPTLAVASAENVEGKKAADAGAAKSTVVQTAIKWMTDVLALKDLFDRLLTDAWGREVSIQTTINEVRLGTVSSKNIS
jgi:hypothetical protein